MGERNTNGLKLLDSFVGLAGLCRGITRPTFQMFGIFALFTEKFMVSVRYLSPMGPRCVGEMARFYLRPVAYFSLCL